MLSVVSLHRLRTFNIAYSSFHNINTRSCSHYRMKPKHRREWGMCGKCKCRWQHNGNGSFFEGSMHAHMIQHKKTFNGPSLIQRAAAFLSLPSLEMPGLPEWKLRYKRLEQCWLPQLLLWQRNWSFLARMVSDMSEV